MNEQPEWAEDEEEEEEEDGSVLTARLDQHPH